MDLCLSKPPWSLPQEGNCPRQLFLTVESILNLTNGCVCHSPPNSSDPDLVTIPLTWLRNLRKSRGWAQLLFFLAKYLSALLHLLYPSHCHSQCSVIPGAGHVPPRWCHGKVQLDSQAVPPKWELDSIIVSNVGTLSWLWGHNRRPCYLCPWLREVPLGGPQWL